MDELYPAESQRMDFVGHLEELRRRIFICLGTFVFLSAIFWWRGQALLKFVEAPAAGIIPQFIFTTPTEGFLSYLKVILTTALIVAFPVVLYELWAFVAPAAAAGVRRRVVVWFFFALLCFWGGAAFGYFLMLPAALKFLISFGAGLAAPMISLARYVGFATTIILIGAMVFEVPVAIGLLTALGVVNSKILRSTRKYAILGIFICAAVVTPTQDIFNMFLVAGPMVVLYEIGIIVAGLVGRNEKKPDAQRPAGADNGMQHEN